MGRRIVMKPFNMEYKAIDLGLPSGRLWADKNVGAEKETGK